LKKLRPPEGGTPMGYLITAFTDDVDLFNKVLGSNDPRLKKAEDVETDADVLPAYRRLVEVGLDGDYVNPAAVIRALKLLCDKYCSLVGSIDHFRYDPDDFPELWKFQFGDSSSALQLPVDLDNGIPAINHWPTQDIVRTRDGMREVSIGSRKEYTHEKFRELASWLEIAASQSKELIVFYE
jgi:hypothetical protein